MSRSAFSRALVLAGRFKSAALLGRAVWFGLSARIVTSLI